MRFLIFGCGYLGRRVAAIWVMAGHEVFAVTRSLQNAESFRASSIRPIVADICDQDSLRHLPEVDVVLHAVGFDRNSGRTHQEVTCDGMQNVLSAIAGRCSRFIHISSTSVYGQAAGEWVDEGSECIPTQPGGQRCVEAERLVREHFSTRVDASANTLRLAGIYGPDRLLSRIAALKAGLKLVGPGNSWLNLIHIDDAVAAVVACEKRNVQNETYIVVDDQPVLRSTYFEQLASLVGAPAPTFDNDQPSPRGSGGLNKRCSNKKLRSRLDWIPAHPSITTGLRSSIDDSAT